MAAPNGCLHLADALQNSPASLRNWFDTPAPSPSKKVKMGRKICVKKYHRFQSFGKEGGPGRVIDLANIHYAS